MKHIIYGTRAVMSYDKKNKILTIGEFPGPQFTNPHKFKLEYGDEVVYERIGIRNSYCKDGVYYFNFDMNRAKADFIYYYYLSKEE